MKRFAMAAAVWLVACPVLAGTPVFSEADAQRVARDVKGVRKPVAGGVGLTVTDNPAPRGMYLIRFDSVNGAPPRQESVVYDDGVILARSATEVIQRSIVTAWTSGPGGWEFIARRELENAPAEAQLSGEGRVIHSYDAKTGVQTRVMQVKKPGEAAFTTTFSGSYIKVE